jgi:hypothetical protein
MIPELAASPMVKGVIAVAGVVGFSWAILK